jgi:hypothetical protein
MSSLDPPRPVSFPLRAKVLFGGVTGQIGWIFLLVGSIVCWVFVPRIDWKLGAYEATATGLVDHVEATSASENDRTIYEVRYHFESLDGTRVDGVSYSTDIGQIRTGADVMVEFDPGDPSSSRIAGARSKPFPIWTAFVLIFPLIGAVLAAFGLRSGARALSLLRRGRIARGRLIRTQATRMEVNDRPVLAMTFAFQTDDGETHEAVARTHRPRQLQDDAEETLFYDPADPSRATLLDHLPGGPYLGPRGQLASGSHLPWPLYLLVPAGWLVGNVWFLAGS